MAFPIEEKLVIAVASSALFDLAESDKIFRENGEEDYRRFQRENQKKTLKKGVAFPFIRRLLHLNKIFLEEQPVEVVLLSRNDPDTGLRVFNSIKDYGLNITRAGFTSGKSPFEYIPAFNTSLFLSANAGDVRRAVNAGYPAGTVLRTRVFDDADDRELRVAFDFDGVIADDTSELVYQQSGDVEKFHDSEMQNVEIPHDPGPLQDLFKKLALFQRLERERIRQNPDYQRALRTAIVTARGAPAHERIVTTLREWGVSADETFFLGGVEKRRVLEIMKPHIYFDDQLSHLKSAAGIIPSVHIPFGINNRKAEK